MLLGEGAASGEGGGGADALHVLGVEGVAYATHQQRDVGALTAAVGVELVEDEEAESLGRLDEGVALPWAGQDVLQHHVVGEQDVRGRGDDLLALQLVLLTRVAAESDRPLVVRVAEVDELFELPELAVRQGIHRVDDDGLHTLAGSVAQDRVDDGTM